MAKTKEEVLEYISKQNWCNAWKYNLQHHSHNFPKTLNESLDYMYKNHLRVMRTYITCNYVSIGSTPQGYRYWEEIGDDFTRWYES